MVVKTGGDNRNRFLKSGEPVKKTEHRQLLIAVIFSKGTSMPLPEQTLPATLVFLPIGLIKHFHISDEFTLPSGKTVTQHQN
jgi:uncharacterized membrane protein